jgi:tetratricopeptide (TPR) repeat protein
MKWQAWLVAGCVAAAPWAARANVALDPPQARLGQGVELVLARRWADAEKQLREALRQDPTLAEAHYNLGIALRAEGRTDEAIAELHEALGGFTRPADRAKALYAVGMIKEARGDRDAWDDYLAFARPLESEQPVVHVAEEHREALNGVKVPGTQKASR